MTAVYLAWDNNGTDHVNTGVQRRLVGAPTWVTLTEVLPSSQTFYEDDAGDGVWEYRSLKKNAQGFYSYSNVDTVSINAVVAPLVEAGAAVSGAANVAIQLNGVITAGSDPSPVALWTQLSGPGSSTFSNDSIAAPTVTIDTDGSYVFQLSAAPNDGPAVLDTVACTVSTAAVAPTVDAGVAADATTGVAFQLAPTVVLGTDTSPVYAWTKLSGTPGVVFSNAAIEAPTVTIDADGPVTLQLSVDPNDGAAVLDTVVITAAAAAGKTLIMHDDFVGTNGALIAGRTPDTLNTPGNDWAENASGGVHQIDTNAAKATLSSKGSGPVIDLATPNVEMEMTIDSLAVWSNMVLFLRSPVADAFGKWGCYYNGNNSMGIVEGGAVRTSSAVSGSAIGRIIVGRIDTDDILHCELYESDGTTLVASVQWDTLGVNNTINVHGFSANTGAVGNKIGYVKGYSL